jgi:hypothetical protein
MGRSEPGSLAPVGVEWGGGSHVSGVGLFAGIPGVVVLVSLLVGLVA